MDRKTGLAAALAAIVLAAGIESASAIEVVTAFEPERQRIETSTSIADLQLELDQLRAADPNHPLIAFLMGRIIALSQPDALRVASLSFDLMAPY